MTRYGMAVDNQRCIGCWTCSMACKLENNLPREVWWNRIVTEGGDHYRTASGTYPDSLKMQMYPVHCMHCENPACEAACPTGATWKDEQTGVVSVDYDACIGCQSCIAACPYEGVRIYIDGEPDFHYDWAIGDAGVAAPMANTVEKCNFCAAKLARGERPACVDICVGRARYFGDLDDPASEISQILASRDYRVLQEEDGTGPSVFYLV